MWLRERGWDLGSCRQGEVDTWFATPPSTRVHATPFLRWAIATRRAPQLELARGRFGNARVLDHAERIEILRRLLDPSTGYLHHRVAAMMLVLLGQPFTRIAALTLSDFVVDGDGMNVRLAEGVVPVPPPFATMVTELMARRPNLNTATNPTSPYLFPGRTAGNHLRPSSLRLAVIRMGIYPHGCEERSASTACPRMPTGRRCGRPGLQLPSDGPSRPAGRLPVGLLRRSAIPGSGLASLRGRRQDCR